MLVYVNNFQSSEHDDKGGAFNLAAAYLSEILGQNLSADMVTSQAKAVHSGGGVDCETCYMDTGAERILSISLEQQESDIGGRLWSTELAISEGDKETISVLVKTEDLCIGNWKTLRKIRPKFIDFIEKSQNFRKNAVGRDLWNLENSEAAYLRLAEAIKDEQRAYPIIFVSSTKLKPPIDAQELQRQLFGLAQIVYIGRDYDFGLLKRCIGTPYFAVGGAINIIFPYDKERGLYPYKLSSWHDLAGEAEADIMARALSQVTRRTNFIKKHEHISFKDIWLKQTEQQIKESERRFKEKLADARAKGEDAAALDELLEEYEVREANFAASKQHMEEKIKALNIKLNASYQDIDNKDIELEELRKQPAALLSDNREASAPPDELIALIAEKGKSLTPEKCLDLLADYYPQQLIVLETARKSAQKAEMFKHSAKLLGLLHKLVREYLPLYLEGGDNNAAGIFGSAVYAAKESEQTMNNPRCAAARSFLYKDREIVMWQHLRIGVKDDARETIRVHFAVEDGKIIIGHCGAHLPIISV